MQVLFLAPDTHVYNHGFVRGLRSIGADVFAIGPAPQDQLAPPLRELLRGYAPCARLFDHDALLQALRTFGPGRTFDRVEAIDEPLVEPAARLRATLGVPGLSVETARLCRDKVAMKEHLRARGIPCAASAAVREARELRAFAERVGYPLILKPVAGFGSLQTYRLDNDADVDRALQSVRFDAAHPLAVEEFVEGHEGFFDTITDGEGVRHEFAAHYFPSCLQANQDRTIAPQIAVTNRIAEDGYDELRSLGHRVVDALGIRHCGTHMEWFFGPKGMKFSEIGARPAGEKIWDMYRFANEFDVYREWALAILGRPGERTPTRRFSAGSVQIRPDRDGRFVRHEGVEQVFERCKPWLYEYEVPAIGAPTKPLDKGWLVNTWFRLRHEDYDELRRLMTWIGSTVRSYAA